MSPISLYPLRFEPIYQYRLWGGRRLSGLLSAPLPSDGPIGEAWVTYSALGQRAPLAEKGKWDSDFAKRKKIKAILDTLIPEFSVRIGGATSIDVTKHGIDKTNGIKKLGDILGISLKEIIYIGDALFVGGNDYPAEQAGVISIPVRGPRETKRVVEAIIACLDDGQQVRPFKVDG
jgi:hypothetical protein